MTIRDGRATRVYFSFDRHGFKFQLLDGLTTVNNFYNTAEAEERYELEVRDYPEGVRCRARRPNKLDAPDLRRHSI